MTLTFDNGEQGGSIRTKINRVLSKYVPPVESIGLNTPPGSPTDGEFYIVGTAPTGDWAGNANAVVLRNNGAWEFTAAQEGMFTFNKSDNKPYANDGTNWTDDFTTPMGNNVYVSTDGDDNNGSSNISDPLATISAAITLINTQSPSSTNRFTIICSAGNYTEAPFTLPEGVVLQAVGSRLINSTPANDFITCSNDSWVIGAIVSGTTGTGRYDVVTSSTSATSCINLVRCKIGAGSTGGVKTTATASGERVNMMDCMIVGATESGIKAEANSHIIANNVFIDGNGALTRGSETDTSGSISFNAGEIRECATAIYHNSTGNLSVNGLLVDDSNTVPLERIGTSPVLSRGAKLDDEKLVSAQVAGLQGDYFSTAVQEPKKRIIDELSVGLPGLGKESAFGEGDSYVNGMRVFTFDGSTYVDVTDAAKSSSGSTFTFPNTSVNSAIYVTSQRRNAANTDFLMYFDMNIDVDTAVVGGEIVAEYYNGTTWVELNTMSVEASGEFLPHAKELFQRTGKEEVFFNPEAKNSWAVNDDPGTGLSTFWMRYRISTALTAAPIFQKFKVGTNRAELDTDGFLQHFGSGRPKGFLFFDVSTFLAANNSPSNQDVFLSDNLGVGRVENDFNPGAVDRSTMVLPLPPDLDTSAPIKADFFFYSDDVSTTNCEYNVYWASSRDGDGVYLSTASAPTTAPGEQSLSQNVAPPGTAEQQYSVSFELDVSDFITRRTGGANGDLFWLSIERDGAADSNPDFQTLIQVEVEYTKWSAGGHE